MCLLACSDTGVPSYDENLVKKLVALGIPCFGCTALGSELWAEGTYDVRSNNCEHFARWCVNGWGFSEQVVNFSIIRSGVGFGARAVALRFALGTIGRVAAALGLAHLVPGVGWLLFGAWIVYAGFELLAKGLGIQCNGHRVEIGGTEVRRAALANGVKVPDHLREKLRHHLATSPKHQCLTLGIDD